MTYYYINKGILTQKIGGDPPSNEYVAIDPAGMVRHIKNGEIIQTQKIDYPVISKKDLIEFNDLKSTFGNPRDTYTKGAGFKIAKNMLGYRKKRTKKPKIKRCKCK